MSNEYDEWKQEQGLGSSGGGEFYDPIDPPVLIKGERTYAQDDPRAGNRRRPNSEMLLSEALLDVYRLDREELADLQQRLWSGGFYGDQKPVVGDYDTAAAAYKRAGMRAANFLQAGVTKTIDDVIADAVGDNVGSGGQGRDILVGGNVGGANSYTINLADPAALADVADKVAQAVLGRKANKAEREKAVSSIRAAQDAEQRKQVAANEGQDRASFNARVSAERQKGDVSAVADNERISVAAGQEVTSDFVAQTGKQLAGQYGLRVTSHTRSPEKNKAVGGAKKSDHLTGHGIDLAGDPKKMAALASWARENSGPGKMFRYVEYGTDDHKDHVHLSFNKGSSPGASAAPAGSRVIDLPDTYLPPTVTNVEQVDPEARIEDQLRQTNPDEAGAHDIAETFGSFMKLIGGVV